MIIRSYFSVLKIFGCIRGLLGSKLILLWKKYFSIRGSEGFNAIFVGLIRLNICNALAHIGKRNYAHKISYKGIRGCWVPHLPLTK